MEYRLCRINIMYAQMSKAMPFQHGFTKGWDCLDMTLRKPPESCLNYSWTHKLCLRWNKKIKKTELGVITSFFCLSSNTVAEMRNVVKRGWSVTECAGVTFLYDFFYYYICSSICFYEQSDETIVIISIWSKTSKVFDLSVWSDAAVPLIQDKFLSPTLSKLNLYNERIEKNRAATNDDFHCQLICWLFSR